MTGGGIASAVKSAAAVAAGVWAGEFLTSTIKAKVPSLRQHRFYLVQLGLGLLATMFGRKIPVVGKFARPVGAGLLIGGLYSAAQAFRVDGPSTASKIGLADSMDYGVLGDAGGNVELLGDFVTLGDTSQSYGTQMGFQGY